MKELANSGIKEIVLTGINLGDFGKGDEGGKKSYDFYDLIQAMDEVDGIDRIRISSIEPNLLTDDIIRFVAQSKRFMPHFHIPLQSGSDKILGAMRRRYKRDLYENRINTIKEVMPHCCIGADVIVGFPGESDGDFRETFEFLHRIPVSYLHVFTYSERTNTLAAEMKPVVPVHVRNERNKTLRNLSYQKMQYFTAEHAGNNRKVLFEKAPKGSLMEGFTDNYIKVQTPYRGEWANQLVDWVL